MRTVFVGYVNRSGSTLLLSELSRVKGFVCFPESERLAKALLERPYRGVAAGSKIVKALDWALQHDHKLSLFPHQAPFGQLIGRHEGAIPAVELFMRFVARSALAQDPGCSHAVFKNTHLPFIFRRIRAADWDRYRLSLVNLVRDPRAVFLSQRRSVGSWGRPMSSSPYRSAWEWRRFVRASDELKRAAGGRVLEILYEDLVAHPWPTIDRLVQWLGGIAAERLEPAGYAARIPPALRGIHANIDRAISPYPPLAWQEGLTPRESKAIERICAQPLRARGYELAPPQPFGGLTGIGMATGWIGARWASVRGIHIPPQHPNP